MRRLLFVFSFGAIVMALPAFSQERPSSKLGEYDEIIIKRKGGDKDAKVTIEIKGGEVFADGKKLDEFQDKDIIVRRRVIVPRNGNLPPLEEQELSLRPNPAVLGVITRKEDAKGATISEVAEGSAAEKAGLKIGDVITGINDKKILEPQELYEAIGGLKAGDKITVTYLRDGKENKATATLDKRPDAGRSLRLAPEGDQFRFRMPEGRSPFGNTPDGREYPFAEFFRERGGARLGLSVQDTEEANGAAVLEVADGSAADNAGFKEKDVITELAGKPVKNAKDVVDLYKENKEGKSSITAKVKRNGTVQTLTIKVPKKLNKENL
ncbi:PDZ domain-containing protein [Chitinophaga sp. SYP-B3965]|uniref:PDZ domain-containing protein n=1 Tax=Chitinophaga sp. SYP-B3965 TaxID=2663120 RepID=UPI00129954DC|nr:PDZ domain-containing protein [Chitinophaga sp. SYP-B3965]MRG49034.1 PDZ domain-containing protein [Chitinophaga sp. SYP-B3965]